VDARWLRPLFDLDTTRNRLFPAAIERPAARIDATPLPAHAKKRNCPRQKKRELYALNERLHNF
uniref:hypothetical protein n=1 Tax=Klebsiella pneumoniae TaxID=573 RepID=UPI0028F6E853